MSYFLSKSLLPGPFSLNSKYGKFLPYFLSIDEKQDYEHNKKKFGKDWHYSKKEITYDLNSNFYRAPDWNSVSWKDSVVVFGCSHVFGEGLANDETLVYQLEKIIDRPVINLGQSGTSPMFSWHNSLRFFELFGVPYAVVQIWSDYSRFLYYDDNELKRVGHWSGSKWDDYDDDMKQLYRIWNKTDSHSKTFFRFEAVAAHNFWSTKTRYYQASFFESTASLLEIQYLITNDVARDMIHSGHQSHHNAARTIAINLV